jgi:hypothetical protein
MVLTLLGDLNYEPGMEAAPQADTRVGVVLQAACGPNAITLDADGSGAVVTNTLTHAMATYLPR